MPNFLLVRPKTNAGTDTDADDQQMRHKRPTKSAGRQSPQVLASMVLAASLLVGCQPQSEVGDSTANAEEQAATEEMKPVPQSDSAAAHIKQMQPVYVAQMQSLQRRLQAEYESLQAADMTTSEDDLLLNNVTNDDNEAAVDTAAGSSSATANNSTTDAELSANESDGLTETVANTDTDVDTDINIDTELEPNSSIDAGERDLSVLRRISAEPRKTTILTEKQIIDSYQQTIDALYQPISQPLSSAEVNTLINIAALIPQLFEHTELADRLNAKSPALARLIVQHQIWEQIEARQARYMQEMKIAQQQEFEELMTKFNETIKDYDEQIAKYEQTLEEFQ
ncbi:hypothetical protein [uncultured Psychrobacter sp.]|uniref:hypothetical protein n=1 Tax=uncultured Psychrobacter sp. TaxID=259303 RepID=UPI002627D682|nr:hypothetical protein [uncultured Psychrobacter sp.]